MRTAREVGRGRWPSRGCLPRAARRGRLALPSPAGLRRFGNRCLIALASLCLIPWLSSDLTAAAAAAAAGPIVRTQSLRPTGAEAGFTRMPPATTGIRFTNTLTGDFRITNAVPHNGSGVAIGDVNNDGRPDIFLAALEGRSRLYRNLGGWRFEETDPGDAACPGQASTGVTFADIDGDADLDLLVNGIGTGTRLFLNDGTGKLSESRDSGLSRTSSATSLALADIDGDGDLDLYVTHYIDVAILADPTTRLSIQQRDGRWFVESVNGQSALAPPWKDRFFVRPDRSVVELPEADGFYRNDGRGRFTPIHAVPGTFLDPNGKTLPPDRAWGLSVMFRDLDGDGAPDLYVCNDSGSADRLWLNTGKGTFRAAPPFALRHASFSSMGVDFADLDRDGHDDFIVLDMLARDHVKRMTQLSRGGPSSDDAEKSASRPRYARNTLFMGRPEGYFVETALFAGVAASDWSWCPIFLDVDLDGYEDLLVSNGFEQDVLDQDTTDEFGRSKWTVEQVKRYRGLFPAWPTANAAFRNLRDGRFAPASRDWGFDEFGVSNGMALGDLDGDGDLDLVVNNLNAVASVYRNDSPAGRIAVRLKGQSANTQGVGARIRLVGGAVDQHQEMICGGRYLSGDQALRVFAAESGKTHPLRLEVRWRSGRQSVVTNAAPNTLYELDESAASSPPGAVPFPSPAPAETHFVDATPQLDHRHRETPFDDSALQPLIPRRLSRLGPGVAWFDVNGDGWEDLIVAASGTGLPNILLNEGGTRFKRLDTPRSGAGDQGAVVGWADGQGNRLLLGTVSNYELPPRQQSQLLLHTIGVPPRALPAGQVSPGPIAVGDFDGDGDLDVFVGGHFLPGRYPEPVASTVWRNHRGELRADPELSAPFQSLGLVCGAVVGDLDGQDGPELALALDWGAVRVFRNRAGRFEDMTQAWGLASRTGCWTGIALADFDGDGRLDIAIGNRGRNTPFELFPADPQPALRIYHGDWNAEGRVHLLEAWLDRGRWLPVANRLRIPSGLPDIAARFPTHRAYAQASLDDILAPRFALAQTLEVNELASGVFLNRSGSFDWIPLPLEAQLAPAFAVNPGDFDGDGIEDLFLSQNFFGTPPGLSRDDAGFGLWLRGLGDGRFHAVDPSASGIRVFGEQRGAALADFNHDGRIDLAVSQNGDATRLFVNRRARRGLRLTLQGPTANPDAIGALVRVVYSGSRMGPARNHAAGSGYWSQDGVVQVLGCAGDPEGVWIRWPGGREQTVPVVRDRWELRVSADPTAR